MKRVFAMALAVMMMLCLFVGCEKESDSKGSSKSKGYEEKLQIMADMRIGKVSKKDILSLYHEKVCEAEELDSVVDELLEYAEEMRDEMEEELGSNLKASYKVIEKEELTGEDLEDLKENLNSRYDINEDDIEKAYSLNVEFTFKGSDNKERTEQRITFACIDGEWFLTV